MSTPLNPPNTSAMTEMMDGTPVFSRSFVIVSLTFTLTGSETSLEFIAAFQPSSGTSSGNGTGETLHKCGFSEGQYFSLADNKQMCLQARRRDLNVQKARTSKMSPFCYWNAYSVSQYVACINTGARADCLHQGTSGTNGVWKLMNISGLWWKLSD